MIKIMQTIFSNKTTATIVDVIGISALLVVFIIIGFAAWYQRIKLRELKKQIDES